MFMANYVSPFAMSLSVGNKLLLARLLASLRLALVRHERSLAEPKRTKGTGSFLD